MSEFGSGVVVCLLKFGEHLRNRQAEDLRLALDWQDMEPREREASLIVQPEKWASLMLRLDREEIERIVGMSASHWAQGASDHLIDLDLKRAPQTLLDLRTLLIRLRYAENEYFTKKEWQEINGLYREAAMDIDEQIVGTTPDWGESCAWHSCNNGLSDQKG